MLEIIEVFLEKGDIFSKLFSLSFVILFIIADWRIHTKAGEKGWIALIPVYNVYSFYKIVWRGRAFWYGVVLSVVLALFDYITDDLKTANAFVIIIGIILALLSAAYLIYTNYKTAKAFGHGAGFTIGLTFLYQIFILIISFGKSKYVKRD